MDTFIQRYINVDVKYDDADMSAYIANSSGPSHRTYIDKLINERNAEKMRAKKNMEIDRIIFYPL